MTEFQVNDPVHVDRGESQPQQQLEGVVAHVGAVQFAQGSDWIGVRLTGSSVGLGKNDGTIQGVSYFSCGPNTGVFVRKAHVRRRNLTRLEELRLKRELAAAGRGAAAPTNTPAAATPSSFSPRRNASSASTSRRTSPAGRPTRTTTTPATATRSRLDELQERRAALAQQRATSRTSTLPTPSSPPPTTTTTTTPPRATKRSPTAPNASSTTTTSPTPSSVPHEYQEQLAALQTAKKEQQDRLDTMQQRIQELMTRLQTKEEENAGLHQALSSAEQALHDATAKQQEQGLNENVEDSVEGLQQQLSSLHCKHDDVQEQLEQVQRQYDTKEKELQQERADRSKEVDDLTQTRAELAALQHEVQARSDQATQRTTSDMTLYKEQARLQAQVGALTRKVEDLERDKVDSDSTLEELTLDKEQLQEEKDALQDRLEELKIDSETAQMEVEELRMELEDARAAAEAAPVSGEGSGEADDMAQALSVQNARLREALIRLREQSTTEKMELARDLRAAEKDAAAGRALLAEVESLRSGKSLLQEQIADLKDMVEQGSAFEGMVETLSDRVLVLEDDNVALQSTIREMEEAADITAEMEEVQAEENKALMRDLESRDAIVRNLEEAIKMQRRREEDFQATVAKYRKSAETLKQEKAALLDLQQGGEGEKSSLLVSSQKALARAAELVSDASNARRRDAQAAFDRIDAAANLHLAQRLESLLPASVAGSEVASIKGETLICTVVGKASRLLEGIASVLEGTIRSARKDFLFADRENVNAEGLEVAVFTMSDEATGDITEMVHLTDFALSGMYGSVELVRLLAAGQWPDLLSPEESTVLGALVGHSVVHLDDAFGSHLKLLKEEGTLSPHRTNLHAFQQDVRNTLDSLRTSIDAHDDLRLPGDWTLPSLHLFKDVSEARFCLLGAEAIVMRIKEEAPSDSPLEGLSSKLEKLNAVMSGIRQRLNHLDTIHNEQLVLEGSQLISSFRKTAAELLEAEREAFAKRPEYSGSDIVNLEAAADRLVQMSAPLSSLLQAAGLRTEEVETQALSPEVFDPWETMSSLVKRARSVNGDQDDVNYLLRANALESLLAEAVGNEPKLALANSKVASLEKGMSSRSKEIAMQNARLSELEKLLAKSNSQPTMQKKESPTLTSMEEINVLHEENKVLTEAMDVLQRQVDDYEQSMRIFTSPKATNRSKRSGGLLSPDLASLRRTSLDAMPVAGSSSGLEAVLFRPALLAARQDASRWKGETVSSIALGLPALLVPGEVEGLITAMSTLSSSQFQVQMKKASVTIVDLSMSNQASSKMTLMGMTADIATTQRVLRDATVAALRRLTGVHQVRHQCSYSYFP